MNKQQMKGYYSQATKMADKLYEHLTEIFAKTPCVVYCVNVARWHDHVTVDIWINIGIGFAPDVIREMVGTISMEYSFSPWRHESASDFIQQVKYKADAYFIRVEGIINDK